MPPKNRIIIDTDPGIDDVLALLLALSASPEELEVVMISVTYGNVSVHNCSRNAVALFHVLEKELNWRAANGKTTGRDFGALRHFRPIVAIGPEHPLEDELLMADFFHGADGLYGVHETHPHLSPGDSWCSHFMDDSANSSSPVTSPTHFTPSRAPAHQEILRILKEEPSDSITICALGPLTNLALAAAEDPETFLRVKEVVVMGGAINVPGNITPVAEFNCYADTVAAARVYALTSPTPQSTMPPVLSKAPPRLGPYPDKLSRPLNLTLLPLDITTPHEVTAAYFTGRIKEHKAAGSPLAQWLDHFVGCAFEQIERMLPPGVEAGLSLHDPMTVWYVLSRDNPRWKDSGKLEDIRIETSGQWARGMHIVDRRIRSKAGEDVMLANPNQPLSELVYSEFVSDTCGWLSVRKGNRIRLMTESPGFSVLPDLMMDRLFA